MYNSQGTHDKGLMTFFAGADIPHRYLFGAFFGPYIIPAEKQKFWAIAVICDTGKKDEIVAAKIMGSNCGTMKVLAGGPICSGDLITANALGKAVNYLLEEDTGTYKIYGIALSPAQSGQCVEFTPTLGLQLTK